MYNTLKIKNKHELSLDRKSVINISPTSVSGMQKQVSTKEFLLSLIFMIILSTGKPEPPMLGPDYSFAKNFQELSGVLREPLLTASEDGSECFSGLLSSRLHHFSLL